jgi:MFS family permease
MLCQVPITRALKRLSHTHTLTIAAILWGIGFSLIGITGIAPSHHLLWAALALGVFAIAIVTYTPAAAAFVTELAPPSQRGVYFSISSISWALGNTIGSPLGGWALDQPQIVVYCLWFSFCLGVLLIVAIMQYLKRILPSQ